MCGKPQTSTRICPGACNPATSVLVRRAADIALSLALSLAFSFSRATAPDAVSDTNTAQPSSSRMARLTLFFILFFLRSKTAGRDDRALLALVARQHALHCARPPGELPLPRRLAHRRLETVLQPPIVGEFCGFGIDAGIEPGEIGSA